MANALYTAVFRNCSFSGNTAPEVSRGVLAWELGSLCAHSLECLILPEIAQGNGVWTHSPYSTVTFVKCDGTKVPMTDCCTVPVLPTCPPTPARWQ